jgi:hypothetical protein
MLLDYTLNKMNIIMFHFPDRSARPVFFFANFSVDMNYNIIIHHIIR